MTRPSNPTLAGEILDTAEKIVTEDGHGALSMRRLADAAGVTPTTLYYYYQSKDHLLHHLRVRTAKRLNGRLQRLDLAEPRRALIELAGGYITFAEENPRLYRLLIEPIADASGAGADERRTLHFPYFAAERVLDALAAPGTRGGDTRHGAMTRWIMLHGFVSLLTSGALESVVDLDRDEIKANFLEAFAGGVQARSGGPDGAR